MSKEEMAGGPAPGNADASAPEHEQTFPGGGTPGAKKPSAAERGDGQNWHRLHPLTPFFKGWGLIAVALAAGVYNADENIPDLIRFANRTGWHWIALAVFALLLIALAWAFIWWRRAYFQITDTSLEWATGVVFRARRTARLDRIEAVDTIHPLIPRLFGLVKLKIESAGGAGSAVELAYLTAADAAFWRREILSRAAVAKQGAGGTPAPLPPTTLPAGDAFGGAPGPGGPGFRPVPPNPAGPGGHPAPPNSAVPGPATPGLAAPGLAASAAEHVAQGYAGAGGTASAGASTWNQSPVVGLAPKSTETHIGELLGDSDAHVPELFSVPTSRVIASLALSAWTWMFVITAIASVIMLFVGPRGSAAGFLAPVFGFGSYVYSRLVSDFGFSAKQTDRGLTLSHGLTTRVSQTIAPGRVLAVSLNQGPLWRRCDWWRVRMTVAGYGSQDADKQSVLVPVANSETARRAIWGIAPELAQADRWEVIRGALTGSGPTPGFTGSPRRARLFDPWIWKRTAYAVTPEALILRQGRLLRRATIVFHGRIQGLELSQGPFERRRDLADVTIYLPPGPVAAVISHLAGADALALLEGETARLRASMNQVLASRGPTTNP
ncbi:MAG: PH domain-containing protein [Bifidobacteriaceae bacterium]|nr:PH domain-containing protein [Bifidobacteriaceae bacterium]